MESLNFRKIVSELGEKVEIFKSQNEGYDQELDEYGDPEIDFTICNSMPAYV